MKNRLWAILVMLLLFSLLSVSALADTAVVNASSLNVRESASSKSDVVKVVKDIVLVVIKIIIKFFVKIVEVIIHVN